MVFISTKVIKGKKRYYLERSVRLVSGKIKKYSLYLPDTNTETIEKSREILNKKVEQNMLKNTCEYYTKNCVFTEENIQKIETIKWNYKKLLQKLTPKQYQDIIDRFTINFTYESNAIEGNSLTLKDVTMILQENKAGGNKNLREVYETLNTRKALEFLFYNDIKITEKSICELHEVLVKETDVKTGYKKFPNFLLGRTIKTVPPEKVSEEMQKLLAWYHENKTMHPLQKAAQFHALFEKIHPFEDGNGRVGRILLNAILRKHGYMPLIIRKTQRVAYFSALQAADREHYETLYRFLLEKYKKTYEHFFEIYMKYI
jgi:Fic family protein